MIHAVARTGGGVRVRGWLTLLATAGLLACSSAPPAGTDGVAADAAVACVSGLSASCTSLYDPPTFDTIFTKILQPNCATGTGTCHTGDARQGGLAFVNEEEAYGLLKARLVPGDPGCSLLMERLESGDPDFHMPPGTISILPGEACAIVQWISAGAAR